MKKTPVKEKNERNYRSPREASREKSIAAESFLQAHPGREKCRERVAESEAYIEKR